MSNSLVFHAEQMAEKAEELSAFSGLKLLFVRNKITDILSLIGRNCIFDQYTKHDISHINEMLRITDWIIPDETKKAMTSADWLMLVLSIYFHDLGMLVTKSEFLARNNNNSYIDYKEQAYSGGSGKEFLDKLSNLGEEAEQFLYQEYVRKNHAHRIKQWINGEYGDLKGTEGETLVSEINDALRHLDSRFRRDLALVCESHHLDDLDNFTKYSTCVHYGNDPAETVNLHYSAIILRTVDLLHITSDRTPSTQFRLINPTDPISMIEWKKQMAVKAVQPKTPRDENGNVDDSLVKDTIEISAYFDQPDQAEAFFGLNSYIIFMRSEIRKNYDWIQQSIRIEGTKKYLFPWIKIDDEKIETLGFEPRQLQFTVDQSSILQMLVGHTLYNDSSVVIRELVQNGIDAVKLQYCIDNNVNIAPEFVPSGKVRIEWNEKSRTLTVSDNGTGMIIDEVETFLLKVGASKYRSPAFLKEYPNFSAISRFGIGILTCFLIADDIDITTNSPKESTANIISLRNVNGKYLLKKVNKDTINSFIYKHGTSISLHVRADVDIGSILSDTKKWIVFPRCEVLLNDGTNDICVGYRSPKEALTQYLTDNRYDVDDKKIKVEEVKKDGISLAYVLRYSEYLRDWEFLTFGHSFFNRDDVYSPLGTCIEGIRVEFTTPGFDGLNIVAIANTLNCSSVLTNVARSAVEDNGQKEKFLSILYSLYAQHCQAQMCELQNIGYSLSWAASECMYLLSPLINRRGSLGNEAVSPQNLQVLYNELRKVKCVIIENGRTRSAVSAEDINIMDSVNLVESKMIAYAESLLRQVQSETTLSNLISAVQPGIALPSSAPVICDYSSSSIIHKLALEDKEVTTISVSKKERRIDLLFSRKADRWLPFDVADFGYHERFLHEKVYIPVGEIEITGLSDEFGIQTVAGLYLSKDNCLTKYLLSLLQRFNIQGSKEDKLLASTLVSIVCNEHALSITSNNQSADNLNDMFRNILDIRMQRGLMSDNVLNKLWTRVDKDELLVELFKAKYMIYRPKDWSREE